MVNKVIVIAIVAMVAVPIGLGYALNFQDVETTRYEQGEATNVTELVQNGISYDYLNANPYQLNGPQFVSGPTRPLSAFMNGNYPNYNTPDGTAAGPIRMIEIDNTWPALAFSGPMLYWQFTTNLDPENTARQNTLTYQIVLSQGSGTYTYTCDNVLWVSMVPGSYQLRTVNGTTYETATINIGHMRYIDGQYTYAIYYNVAGVFAGSWSNVGSAEGNNTKFVRATDDTRDRYPVISDGFNFTADSPNTGFNTWMAPGSGAKNILMTIDLSQVSGTFSIVQNNQGIASINTLVNGVTITNSGAIHRIAGQDVIYEADKPNVYQLVLSDSGVTIRFIGDNWPSTFGEANYFRQWSVLYSELPDVHIMDWWVWRADISPYQVPAYTYADDEYILSLTMLSSSEDPTVTTWNDFSIGQMRIDAADMRSSSYSVIKDNEYNPSNILGEDQTATTIKDVARYGESISFGGNTFKIVNGSIYLPSGRQQALNKCVFESVYNTDTQGYDNRINGSVVSTTAQPSTITFNGVWDANVATSPITSVSSTESKWIAGGWAWDGVGVSFAMVGLITCVGVFIGLGMYGHRSGAKVGGLMLVCAGGALIFLALL